MNYLYGAVVEATRGCGSGGVKNSSSSGGRTRFLFSPLPPPQSPPPLAKWNGEFRLNSVRTDTETE